MCRISLKDINNDYQILDLRDPYSYYRSHLKNAINITSLSLSHYPFNKPTILVCYSGKQARELAKCYHSQGKDCYYLEGGYQSIMNVKNNYY